MSERANKVTSFQEIIFRLERYWSQQGCVILQPYDLMMGAGTFHWGTILKAIGSRSWRTAYVQPSRRPTDGRYGENPNRLQHFYQFQVLLKPSPEDSQRLFLESLAALGLDKASHDIRFVEDDWESPTLGAAGLGWEVWCDGMEICQFTYFQQVGGIECRPVSTELTYGLERIAMFIQNVNDVFEICYDEAGTTYGEIFLEREREYCRYNFEEADVTELWRQFEHHKNECRRLLSLSRPMIAVAYDFCVGASHLFNLLDARKQISHQRRAELVLSVRELANGCVSAKLKEQSSQEVNKSQQLSGN